jgi:hypothetical protein
VLACCLRGIKVPYLYLIKNLCGGCFCSASINFLLSRYA